jgi:hypothetical protein
MLYLQNYQEFAAALAKCREILTLIPIVPLRLKQAVTTLQQQFPANLANRDAADRSQPQLEAYPQREAYPQLEAYEVEINKQLRLLTVDCLFLQTAKQPTTIDQRCRQINQRFDLLQSYCESIVTLLRSLGYEVDPKG